MKWIEQELVRRAREIDQLLTEFLPSENGYPPVIHQAMRYSVLAGGKRLRPILVMAAAEAVGGNLRSVQPVAVALEFIHTYSLIHDDLPAMDNDDFRRGKPTCHKIFGEAAAILAGDALLTLAFEVLAKSASTCGSPPPSVVLQVIQEVAQAAGTLGMIGGQVVDLESEGQPIAETTLEYIHRHKTGALIRASVRAGALFSGANSDDLADLTEYAEDFGLAFQIADDILDVVGDERKLGKPIGSDLRNEKSTFPSLYGLEQSRKIAQDSVTRAVARLVRFGGRARFLKELVEHVIERDN